MLKSPRHLWKDDLAQDLEPRLEGALPVLERKRATLHPVCDASSGERPASYGRPAGAPGVA